MTLACDSLPFVARRTDGEMDHWNVAGTGNPDLDFELGRALARCAVDYMRDHGVTVLLNSVVQAQARDTASPASIKNGFWVEVGMALLTGRA